MNFEKFTIKAQEAVQLAQQLAMEKEHQAIECRHLLRGIMSADDHILPFVFKNLSMSHAR